MELGAESNDHFAQVAVIEVVRQSAKLAAQMLTLDHARSPVPNLGEVFEAELAQELQRIGVPNKVAASMLGVSLSTLHRLRERQENLRKSVVTDLVRALSNGPLDRNQLFLELYVHDPVLISSTVRHLQACEVIVKTDGRFALNAESRSDTLVSGLASIILLVVTEEGAKTEDELVAMTGYPALNVREAIDALSDDGRLSASNGRYREGPNRDYRIDSGASPLVSFTELVRIIMTTLRERLRRADAGHTESPGVLGIRFRQSYFERVNEKFCEFQQTIVDLWTEMPPPDGDPKEGEAVFFFGGASNVYFDPIHVAPADGEAPK